MIFKVSDIVNDVLAAINRDPAPAAADCCGWGGLTAAQAAQSVIVEAARQAQMLAPAHLLELGHSFDPAHCLQAGAIAWERVGGDYCGSILLPADFMRLAVFQMDDWDRPVYEPIEAASTAYLAQRGGYAGLRGNPRRPVCAIAVRAEGLALEFYSCGSDQALVKQAAYVPQPAIDEHGGIDVSERCYGSMVAIAAEMCAKRMAL